MAGAPSGVWIQAVFRRAMAANNPGGDCFRDEMARGLRAVYSGQRVA